MAKFKKSRQVFDDIEDSLNATVNHFLDDFHKEVKRTTPVADGRAKRAWRRRGKYSIDKPGTHTVLENTTPYIGLLDEGSSRQAPGGMTAPAFRKLSKRRYRKRS